MFRWDYERKSFWTARKIKNTRSPSSKTCSREGNGCITHPWPPIDLLCGTDSVLRESVLNLFFLIMENFFFHYYCQFQEDLLSSFDNCNQCSKHALKKLATCHVSSRRRNHFWIGNFVLWHLRAASRHIRPRPARSVSGFICLVVLGGWRSEKVKRGSTTSPPPLSRLINHSEAHGVKTYLSPLSTDSLSTQQMSYFFLG